MHLQQFQLVLIDFTLPSAPTHSTLPSSQRRFTPTVSSHVSSLKENHSPFHRQVKDRTQPRHEAAACRQAQQALLSQKAPNFTPLCPRLADSARTRGACCQLLLAKLDLGLPTKSFRSASATTNQAALHR